jgi:hypothetical protein
MADIRQIVHSERAGGQRFTVIRVHDEHGNTFLEYRIDNRIVASRDWALRIVEARLRDKGE